MIVGVKDSLKLIGISAISFCAVLVCAMFLNYLIDVNLAADMAGAQAAALYKAQVLTAKVVVAVTGGCLGVAAMIMLFFYIKNYIDAHKNELGILKAMGYSNFRIALHFWSFGFGVFFGTALGFAISYAIMPEFYRAQTEGGALPELAIGFHAEVLAYTVIIPTVLFAVGAILYAAIKLSRPVIELIKDREKCSDKMCREKPDDKPFLVSLKRSVLSSKKTLVFFIMFASFCFSAMTQMSVSMDDYAGPMLMAMMMVIGLALAFLSMLIAVVSAVNGNAKTLAMLRVFGYSRTECCNAVLGGYRPFAYLGFAIGTAYQYGLLKIMVELVFKDFGVPELKFDYVVMLISLAAFILLYEGMIFVNVQRIKKISLKQIMAEN